MPAQTHDNEALAVEDDDDDSEDDDDDSDDDDDDDDDDDSHTKMYALKKNVSIDKQISKDALTQQQKMAK